MRWDLWLLAGVGVVALVIGWWGDEWWAKRKREVEKR